MKDKITIFICWSGNNRSVAKAVKDCLDLIFDKHIEVKYSEQLTSGSLWVTKLFDMLDNVDYGLVCLNKENYNSPWMHFEAGAITKSLKKSHVVPMLFDLEADSFSGPFSSFQSIDACKYEEDDAHVIKLIKNINSMLGPNSQKQNIHHLVKIVERSWPDVISAHEAAVKEQPSQEASQKNEGEETTKNTKKLLEYAEYTKKIIHGLQKDSVPLIDDRLSMLEKHIKSLSDKFEKHTNNTLTYLKHDTKEDKSEKVPKELTLQIEKIVNNLISVTGKQAAQDFLENLDKLNTSDSPTIIIKGWIANYDGLLNEDLCRDLLSIETQDIANNFRRVLAKSINKLL